jgi:hypothetical protein
VFLKQPIKGKWDLRFKNKFLRTIIIMESRKKQKN